MTEKNERDRSPAGRFSYLVEKRMSKALKAIDSLSNLSDKRNYEYTAAGRTDYKCVKRSSINIGKQVPTEFRYKNK